MAEISLNNDFDLSGIDWEDLVLKPTPVATQELKNEPPKEAETL